MTLVARIVVIALTGVVLSVAAKGAVTATTDGLNRLTQHADVRGEVRARRQFERIRADLAARVPAGQVIYIPGQPETLWGQRLVEFAAIDGVAVTADPARADLVATVVPDRAAPTGVRLVLEPAR